MFSTCSYLPLTGSPLTGPPLAGHYNKIQIFYHIWVGRLDGKVTYSQFP